jgi:hypothetical protein
MNFCSKKVKNEFLFKTRKKLNFYLKIFVQKTLKIELLLKT